MTALAIERIEHILQRHFNALLPAELRDPSASRANLSTRLAKSSLLDHTVGLLAPPFRLEGPFQRRGRLRDRLEMCLRVVGGNR